VNYTDNYPDELPNLALEPLEGEVDEEEINALLDGAQAVVSMLARLQYCIDTRPCRARKT
jgi:hypothetical protein